MYSAHPGLPQELTSHTSDSLSRLGVLGPPFHTLLALRPAKASGCGGGRGACGFVFPRFARLGQGFTNRVCLDICKLTEIKGNNLIDTTLRLVSAFCLLRECTTGLFNQCRHRRATVGLRLALGRPPRSVPPDYQGPPGPDPLPPPHLTLKTFAKIERF